MSSLLETYSGIFEMARRVGEKKNRGGQEILGRSMIHEGRTVYSIASLKSSCNKSFFQHHKHHMHHEQSHFLIQGHQGRSGLGEVCKNIGILSWGTLAAEQFVHLLFLLNLLFAFCFNRHPDHTNPIH